MTAERENRFGAETPEYPTSEIAEETDTVSLEKERGDAFSHKITGKEARSISMTERPDIQQIEGKASQYPYLLFVVLLIAFGAIVTGLYLAV